MRRTSPVAEPVLSGPRTERAGKPKDEGSGSIAYATRILSEVAFGSLSAGSGSLSVILSPFATAQGRLRPPAKNLREAISDAPPVNCELTGGASIGCRRARKCANSQPKGTLQ